MKEHPVLEGGAARRERDILQKQHRAVSLVMVCVLSVFAKAVSAQTMNVTPTAEFGGYPSTFLDACSNMSSWPTGLARTSELGSFDGDLNSASDSDLATCFSNLRNAGFRLAVEANAFEPGGEGLGVDCFNQLSPKLHHWIDDLGAPQIVIRMQEPLTKGLMAGWQMDDIVFQTVDFMSRTRAEFGYAGIMISSVEAYPYNPSNILYSWMRSLYFNGSSPDRLELDHDTRQCCWSYSDVAAVESYVHSFGYPFAYIFGSPVDGESWNQKALDAGSQLRANSIVPDVFTFESWDSQPWQITPEWTSGTFTNTIANFVAYGYFPW